MKGYEFEDGEGMFDIGKISALDENEHPEDACEDHCDENPLELEANIKDYSPQADADYVSMRQQPDEQLTKWEQVDMARKALLDRSKKRAKISENYQVKQYVDNLKIMG
jgi:hypothetical protein